MIKTSSIVRNIYRYGKNIRVIIINLSFFVNIFVFEILWFF